MANENLKPQLIGAFALAIFAVCSAIKMWHGQPSEPQNGAENRPHHYQVQVLAQEMALTGKIIRAESQGNQLAAYTCGPEDAAVAVISLTDTAGQPNVLVMVEPPRDSNGHKYLAVMYPINGFYFLVLKKGFAHTPDKVNAAVRFFAASGQSKVGITPVSVTFTKIAPAHRILTPPTGEQLRQAEALATAEYVEDQQQLVIKPKSNKLDSTYYILASSFSSPESMTSGNATITNGAAAYLADTDAVMVHLDKHRIQTSEATLTYKNATIVMKNGARVLWLPTTQQVGTITGRDASVLRFDQSTFGNLTSNSAKGVINVSLAKASPHDLAKYYFKPTVELTSISPTPDELGLNSIWVGVEAYSTKVKSTAPAKPSAVTTVPELKIHFRVTEFLRVDPQTVVLPVHHIKTDPAMFPTPLRQAPLFKPPRQAPRTAG